MSLTGISATLCLFNQQDITNEKYSVEYDTSDGRLAGPPTYSFGQDLWNYRTNKCDKNGGAAHRTINETFEPLSTLQNRWRVVTGKW